MDGAEEDGIAVEKKVAPRPRARNGSQPPTAGSVPRKAPFGRAGEVDFLDESGVTTQMTRTWARVPKGERIAEPTLQWHWKVLTTLGAMNQRGMLAAMTMEAATDADIFEAFIEQVLCPKLKPGDVVVLDNLSAHESSSAAEKIAACGVEMIYLPPYSPDLNTFEKDWSKFNPAAA